MTHLQASPSILTTTLHSLVIVLTGGAAGIGLATVTSFISHGACVIFGDVQDSLGEEQRHGSVPRQRISTAMVRVMQTNLHCLILR